MPTHKSLFGNVHSSDKNHQAVENTRDFSYSDCSDADFSTADLQGVNFSNANLRGANFEYANLSGADISNADLRYANLRSANLLGVKWDLGTQFYGAIFTPTDIEKIRDVTLRELIMREAAAK